MGLPTLPKETWTQENVLRFLTLLARPPENPSFTLKYEVNAVALRLMDELRRCREIKDTVVVAWANKISRTRQWTDPKCIVLFANCIGTCAQHYNEQHLLGGPYLSASLYYASLMPLVLSMVSKAEKQAGKISIPLLSDQNARLLYDTGRYFLLGHCWSGIEREAVCVKYISPLEGGSGCWEARLLKWNYPFKLKVF